MGLRNEYAKDTVEIGALRLGGVDVLADGDDLNEFHVTTASRDLMTASSVFGYVPYKSELLRVYVILSAAFTGSDTTFQIRDADGNQAGSISVTASGSEAGQLYQVDVTANEDFAAGDTVQLQTGGQGTGPTSGTVVFVFKRVE